MTNLQKTGKLAPPTAPATPQPDELMPDIYMPDSGTLRIRASITFRTT